MTDAARVEVLGADRLAWTLRAAAAELGHMDEATEATGRLVASRARGNAPKASGRLANSLRVEASGAESRVSSSLVYAGVQHYGWAAHSISPHPFLVPVAAATEPVWRDYYAANVNKVLNNVKGI